MTATWSNLKAKGDCPCGCGAYGTLRGDRCVDGCDASKCARCRGRRNGKLGRKAQAKAARRIGMPVSTIRPGNEEFFGGFVRIECKAGAQVGPVLTRYLQAETQGEGHRPIGDHRPFAAVFIPERFNDALVVCRLSKVDDVVVALAEQLGVI